MENSDTDEDYQEALDVIMVAFEDEKGDDTDRAMETACKNLDKFQWLDCDLGSEVGQILLIY